MKRPVPLTTDLFPEHGATTQILPGRWNAKYLRSDRSPVLDGKLYF